MSGPKRIGTLEIDESMAFQAFEWTVERIGWALMAAVIGMALNGVFGKHHKSERVAGRQNGPLWVEYDRNPHWQTRTVLVVHARPDSFQKEARVAINDDYLDAMMVQQITPEPDRVESKADETTFVFLGEERTDPVVVRFHLEPEKPGTLGARITLNGEHTAGFSQRVYP